MDRIGGLIKNLVYCRVLSGDVVINTPREFAELSVPRQIRIYLRVRGGIKSHASTVNVESSQVQLRL